MRAMRKQLQASGIPVENSQGRVGPGPGRDQRPLRRRADHGRPPRRDEERDEGDRPRPGQGVTFMAKWDYGLAGSSSHIHMSLAKGGKNAFVRSQGPARHVADDAAVRAGLLTYAARHHLFPRALHQLLQALPGRHLRAHQGDLVERQPHRRLPPLRREHQGRPHRVPHRRRRPQPLSRLRRAARRRARRASRRSSTLEPAFSGDAYLGKKLREVPKTLRDATDALRKSKMLQGGARRAGDRPLRPHRRMGAVRIRPPRHRLGVEARVRADVEDARNFKEVTDDRDGQDRLADRRARVMPSGRWRAAPRSRRR